MLLPNDVETHLQWTMGPGPSNVRFASTRMLQGIERAKNRSLPVPLKRRQKKDPLPLSPLVPWSEFKAEFVRSGTQGRFTANQSVRLYRNSFLRGHSDDKCVERCHGPRVELDHWRQVIALHEKHYFVPEKFVIPSSSSAVAFSAQNVPRTPKSAAADAPLSVSTPSTHSTPSSSASLSPQKSSRDPSVRPSFSAFNKLS